MQAGLHASRLRLAPLARRRPGRTQQLLVLPLLLCPTLCGASWSGASQCNQTAVAGRLPPAGQERACPGEPLSALFEHAAWMDAAAKRGAELPFGLEAAYFLTVIGLAQCELGVEGAVGEIGTSRPWGATKEDAGLFAFHLLRLLRRADERLLLGGPFLGLDEDGFDRPETAFDGAKEQALAGLSADSYSQRTDALGGLADTDLLQLSGGRGFRILRVDRLRGANETVQLLRAVVCALADGGVLVLEGISGMSDRPALQEGFHRFMLESRVAAARGLPGPRPLVPFLWAGKRGGLFLAEERHADIYRYRVRRSLPANAHLVNVISDNKFMYGSRILTLGWEAEVRDFRMLMGDKGSRRDVLLTHGQL